ncbi:MAG: bis(5'-nucleosyl)-tetraphosphatase (symmetrical) YqeK [Clostridia bacterium]
MTIDSIVCDIKKKLSEERFSHTLGMVGTALEMAGLYGCDKGKTELAAYLHDIGKSLSEEEQKAMLTKEGYGEDYLAHPSIIHASCSMIMARDIYGVTDGDVLAAIESHTCGSENMSLLQKIIFLADAIEPGREYPEVEDLRKAAFTDLDKGVCMYLKAFIDWFREHGRPIYKDTLQACEYYSRPAADV